MNKTPNFDAKIKSILDALQQGERTCALTGETWMMDEREILQYRKYNVPPSKFSPLTRMKLLNTNICVFDMWYNQHAETGKPMISIIHPGTGFRVISDEEWFDQDFISTGRDVDLSRSIMDQMYDLALTIPQSANFNYVKPENSLAFISQGDKDSYFVLACSSRNTVYSMNASNTEDSAEVLVSRNISRSYNVLHSQNIADSLFVRESLDCHASAFLFDCRNCEFCFGATNKRNKKYLWWNEQLSEEEWKKRRSEVDLASFVVREDYERQFRKLVGEAVWPENWNVQSEDSTGDYITRGTRVQDGFFVVDGSQDLDWVNLAYGEPSSDCSTCSALLGSTDCYYGIGNSRCSKNLFSLSILDRCLECEFCRTCMNCENCFGCFGLRNKKFCIFNKQYTEEEYWKKLDEIKCAMLEHGEYGDLEPARYSTQHWSGCGARHIYGCEKEELIKLGMKDYDITTDGAEGPVMDVSLLHNVNEIPDRADDTIAKTIYFDEVAGRRFSYLAPELAIYRALKIAPPRSQATRRVLGIYAELNIAAFEEASCATCKTPIRTAKNRTYLDRTIYCKECYYAFINVTG